MLEYLVSVKMTCMMTTVGSGHLLSVVCYKVTITIALFVYGLDNNCMELTIQTAVCTDKTMRNNGWKELQQMQ